MSDNKQIAVVRIYRNRITGYVSAAVDAEGEQREVNGAPNMEILWDWLALHLFALENAILKGGDSTGNRKD